MTEPKTFTLDVPGAVLTYDVRETETPGEHLPLFILGSPMAAGDFAQLASEFTDRVVITYDPRGTERSTLKSDGEVSTQTHADDYHRVVEAVGLGKVDVFASSGGAVNVLAWIVDHPDDVRTLVAHEPPLTSLLPDRDMALRVQADIVETYHREGFGPAMAKFIQLVMYPAPLPEDYLDQPAPDPAMFGLPTADDGRRDDLLLGKNLATMPLFEPDLEALRRSPVRIVPAVGEQGEGTMARRGGLALAEALGMEAVVFPGDHGGFVRNEWSPGNDPAAFAVKLREVLAG
ncbi:alpha/beta fold hydrolase [Isoptericola variabilis]|uniref:Alpha/beta hydrolase fold protein n=1 Tax=Isoptericola variabilis (strain 225) TaxID=743718 RepID=F6FRB6_ISOV2|nr:alpha/beta hydrolase [Isoptericola variabilis]AEG42976.1 alpha/beta hydrolase fold protein [Isoptericola variabilis 225]TWH30052.1 pimeloyl-ACP methyl ester carboxylesterase [Isoptericola variabilis J7]